MQLPFASFHLQYRACSTDTACVKEQKTLKLRKNAAQTGRTMQTDLWAAWTDVHPSVLYMCVYTETHTTSPKARTTEMPLITPWSWKRPGGGPLIYYPL